jgi:hypothetical protein
MGALQGVSSAVKSGDGQSVSAALARAKPAVVTAARRPIPSCADPRGYWNVLLMHVSAATGLHSSPTGVRAALVDVPEVMDALRTGVKQSVR